GLRRSTPATCRPRKCASARSAPGRSSSSSSSRTNTSRSRAKKDRPYLDGIEYQIIKNVATGSLAFVSGKVDMTSWYFLQVPMLKDINNQMGQELCHMAPTNVLRSVIINREAPPFGKPEVRRAIALTLDRPAFINTLTQGKGIVGGALLSPPFGVWGMPPDMMKTLPGYGP